LISYVMAAGFLAVGIVAILLAPQLQKIAVSNTRTIINVPLLGAGARWAAGPLYVPTVRAIGVLSLAVALFLLILDGR
jgi:hypothetical protein